MLKKLNDKNKPESSIESSSRRSVQQELSSEEDEIVRQYKKQEMERRA